MNVVTAALVGLALLVAPEIASACPVCNANGEEESRVAFILTTVFLSALPVVMIGLGAWVVWRRVRAIEQAPRPGERRPQSEWTRSPAS